MWKSIAPPCPRQNSGPFPATEMLVRELPIISKVRRPARATDGEYGAGSLCPNARWRCSRASDMLQITMKLVRPLFGIAITLSLLLGQFALQMAGFQRGRNRYSYSMGAMVPSEFYWSRLQYNSGYANGNSFGYRGFGG